MNRFPSIAFAIAVCCASAAIASDVRAAELPLAEPQRDRLGAAALLGGHPAGSIVPELQALPEVQLAQETGAEAEPANTEDSEAEPEFELPQVNVTSGRRERDTFRTPGAITVIERDEIEKQLTGSSTLEDILRSVPGIQFERRGGFFTAEPTLRGGQGGTGAGQTGVLLLVNGIRRNNNNGTVNVVSDFPLEQIERIEVLRGAASSLYGTDAVDGVINIITRRPSADDFNVEISTRGGSTDIGGNIVMSGTILPEEGDSATSVLVQYGYQDSDSFRDADGNVSRNELTENSYSLVFKHEFNLQQELEFSYLGVRNAIESPVIDNAVPTFETEDGFLIMGPPNTLPIDITFPRRNTDQFAIDYRDRDFLNSIFTARLYYSSFERNFTNSFGLSEEIAESDLDSIGGTLLFDSQLTDTFNLLWGMDVYSESYKNDDTDPNIEDTIANLTNPSVVELSPSLARFDEETARRPDGEQRVIGLFAQSDWDINDKLKLTGGLRLDFFRQEAFPTELFQACRVPEFTAGEPSIGPDCGSFVMAGPMVAFAPRFTPFSGQEPQVVDFQRNDREDVRLIPNLGLNWAVSPQFALYGTYSRGVQQPSFFDLYGGPQSFGITIGNPELTAQESNTFDLGLRYRGDRVSVDMAYFRQYYEGQFVNVGEEQFGSSLIRFLDNLNTSVVQGIETEVTWDMSRDWSLFGNFAWTTGRATSDVPDLGIEDGDRLEEIVPFQIVLGVLYENDRGTFGRLQLRSVSDLSDVTESSEALDTDSFAVVDFDFGIPYKNAIFTVGVNNLFNSLYREPFSGFNAPGRTITAGVTMNY